VFENILLGRIFRPGKEKVKGGWRKMQNEELHSLHFSSYCDMTPESRNSGVRSEVDFLGNEH
jgi:hypothetical protein